LQVLKDLLTKVAFVVVWHRSFAAGLYPLNKKRQALCHPGEMASYLTFRTVQVVDCRHRVEMRRILTRDVH
jgi:hypothetical protein